MSFSGLLDHDLGVRCVPSANVSLMSVASATTCRAGEDVARVVDDDAAAQAVVRVAVGAGLSVSMRTSDGCDRLVDQLGEGRCRRLRGEGTGDAVVDLTRLSGCGPGNERRVQPDRDEGDQDACRRRGPYTDRVHIRMRPRRRDVGPGCGRGGWSIWSVMRRDRTPVLLASRRGPADTRFGEAHDQHPRCG